VFAWAVMATRAVSGEAGAQSQTEAPPGHSGVCRLSVEGVFPNGVTAVSVVQFVLDYELSARIEDVAVHFGIGVRDVADALAFYARNRDEMHASGSVSSAG